MVEKPFYGRRSKVALLADGVGQRRHGEGSLFQTTVRGEKVWRASRVVKDANGARRKISGTGATPAQATERLTLNFERYRQEVGSGQAPVPKRQKKVVADTTPSFLDVASEWLEWRRHYSIPDRRKKPLDYPAANQYRLSIKNYLMEWGVRPITEYTTQEIRDFTYYRLQEKNISNSHLRSIQGLVFQVFEFAGDNGYVPTDPARNLVMSSRNKTERLAKMREENLENLAYVPDRIMAYLAPGKTQDDFITDGVPDVKRYEIYRRLSIYEARWAMSALLALRPSEVLGLTWDRFTYLNIKNGAKHQVPMVSIVQQLARNPEQEGLGTKLYIKPNTKSDAGQRSLQLSPGLVGILRDWQAIQKEWKKSPEWKPYPHLSNLVFTTKTGKSIRQQEDSKAWRELLANSFRKEDELSKHIRSLRLYALRHLALTRMVRQGVHLAKVSEIAGHASISLTFEVYGHLDVADRQEALFDLADRTLEERNKVLKK